MYCESRKQKYIRYCTASGADIKYQKKIRLLFSHTENFETAEDTDVSMMSQDQVARMIDLGVLGKTRVFTELCILRSYTMWCAESDPALYGSGILSFVPNGLDDTRRNMVSGDVHLNQIMNELFAPEKDGKSDNLLRAFLWLIYAGVYANMITDIKKNDMNLSDMTVTSGDRVYKLSRLSRTSLLFSSESDTLSINHPQYKSRKRIAGNSIMRGTRSVLTVKDICRRIAIAQDDANRSGKIQTEFTPYSIYKSGRFADMYDAERTGVFPDFSLDVEDFMAHRIDYAGTKYLAHGADASEINKRKLTATFLEDYSRWKLAFTTF